MSRFTTRGKDVAIGLVVAVTGAAVTQTPGVQAQAKYRNGGLAWSVNHQMQSHWESADPDGNGQQDVTPSGGGFDAANQQIGDVAYSPDGTRVAFLASRLPYSYPVRSRLWVSNADGTDARAVSDAIGAAVLAWAPDGSGVYYSAPALSGPAANQIFVAPVDGTAPHPLFATPTGFNDMAPAVSADGRVAFVRAEVGSHAGQSLGVCVLAPGAHRPQLIPGTANAQAPAFSPDGGRIAMVTRDYVSPPPSNTDPNHLVVMNVDGSAATGIYDGGAYDVITDPAWSPDGGKVAWWQPGGLRIMSTAPGSVPEVFPKTGGLATLTWQAGASLVARRPVLDRIGGADRRGTAIAASRWSYDALGKGGRQANVAVLSRDDQFADALSGTALAAQKHGPLLLTGTAGLDGQVRAELKRILAPGSTVYILGGTSALSPAVQQAVTDAGFKPKRLQGPDRFATSVAVAGEIAPNGPHTVLVATGMDFPDALTAGAAAAQDLAGGVVLLSRDETLPQGTKDYLSRVDPRQSTVYGVGAQGVAALRAAFPAWDGLTVALAGADRYATASEVAHSKLFGVDMPVWIAGVATGSLWPDALSGGALVAAQHGPLLLAGPDGLSAGQTSVLTGDRLAGVAVFGGTRAVGDAVADAVADTAFGAGAWDPATNRQAPALP